MTTAMRKGLLLFAHGARDPNWALPFEAVAARATRAGAGLQPPLQVRLAFLEFMQPDLPTAGQALAESGCEHVDVVPLFLGAGGHVRKDLPALLRTLAERYPRIRWELRPAVGEMPGVVAAMAEASLSWIGGGPSSEPTPPDGGSR
ncbi:sirohydrochlorin chelatase [Piscinibacter sakaiensis]|uniref:sirohydrochlorin chelatase n=1 Tax=Piscinibacter sakaiensis TaxID=1547922 RepID=UPI003AAD525C